MGNVGMTTTGARTASGKTVFRQRLMRATLDHAFEVPFYRRRWGTAAAQLSDVPSSGKSDFLADPHEVVHPGQSTAHVAHSTGTTGRPFSRVRGAAEIEAFSTYLRELRRALAQRDGQEQRRSLVFSATPPTVHGSVLPSSLADLQLAINPTYAAGLEQSLVLLSDRALVPDLDQFDRHVVGSPTGLAVLTRYLIDRGVAAEELRIASLTTISDIMLPAHRALLER
jgi:phenylacetate-coenzyme A ligase PaaK-like adenylate-forming protein